MFFPSCFENRAYKKLKANIEPLGQPDTECPVEFLESDVELERESILDRQREGIAIAKEQGLYQGRQKIKNDREHFEAVVREWRAQQDNCGGSYEAVSGQAQHFL